MIWSSLPAEDIQSAEIVRGAGAGPYGAGALTGVIELGERDAPGALFDAELGELGQRRIAGVANDQLTNGSVGASGMYQRSGGWIPVAPSQRGAADNKVSVEASSLSARPIQAS